MINNEKIRLMTKLTVFEEKTGKDDIKLSQYFKTDYVRYGILRSWVSITVAYAFVLILILIYQSEYVIKEAVTLNYKLIGTYVLWVYIMLCIVYIFISLILYNLKYKKSRKHLVYYDKILKKLRKIYDSEDEQGGSAG